MPPMCVRVCMGWRGEHSLHLHVNSKTHQFHCRDDKEHSGIAGSHLSSISGGEGAARMASRSSQGDEVVDKGWRINMPLSWPHLCTLLNFFTTRSFTSLLPPNTNSFQSTQAFPNIPLESSPSSDALCLLSSASSHHSVFQPVFSWISPVDPYSKLLAWFQWTIFFYKLMRCMTGRRKRE